MPDDHDLPFGLYERLVTAGLKAQLLRFDPASTRVVTQELEPTEAHVTLARHIEDVVARALVSDLGICDLRIRARALHAVDH